MGTALTNKDAAIKASVSQGWEAGCQCMPPNLNGITSIKDNEWYPQWCIEVNTQLLPGVGSSTLTPYSYLQGPSQSGDP